MIKLIFLIRKKKGMTSAAFRKHYETTHVGIATEHFGDLILDYRRNYPTSASVNPVDNSGDVKSQDSAVPYDAVTEMLLQDQTALDEMLRRFASPELHAMIAEDEAAFMDRAALTMMVCEEVASWSLHDRIGKR